MQGDCVAIVLAAGAGTRMGGSKALLELKGKSLLWRHVEGGLRLGCAHVAAIVTPDVYAFVRPTLECFGGQLSLIAARTDSQAGSLARVVQERAGADAHASTSTFLITPVDVLPCRAATFHALHAALAPEVWAATPVFAGRGGHPVLMRAELLQPYRETARTVYPPLREVLEGAGSRRQKVAVADRAVARDVDTSAQARALGLIVPW